LFKVNFPRFDVTTEKFDFDNFFVSPIAGKENKDTEKNMGLSQDATDSK
jgi:hypothetical protein